MSKSILAYRSPILAKINNVDWPFSKALPPGLDFSGYCEPDDDQMASYRAGHARYGSAQPVYDRKTLLEIIQERDAKNAWPYRRIRHKHNQKNEPSCTYNATGHAAQNKWNVQFGDENAISLSPIYGYRYNGTPRSGSTVGGAIAWLEKRGLLPTDNAENRARVAAGQFKHVHPDVGYSIEPPKGHEETAKLFRADEWDWVATADEWYSAIVNDHPCVGGRDYHCICHLGLAADRGQILSIYLQSWALGWGFELETAAGPLHSFGADSEAKVRTMVARDGWCLRSMLRPAFMRG